MIVFTLYRDDGPLGGAGMSTAPNRDHAHLYVFDDLKVARDFIETSLPLARRSFRNPRFTSPDYADDLQFKLRDDCHACGQASAPPPAGSRCGNCGTLRPDRTFSVEAT